VNYGVSHKLDTRRSALVLGGTDVSGLLKDEQFSILAAGLLQSRYTWLDNPSVIGDLILDSNVQRATFCFLELTMVASLIKSTVGDLRHNKL
jgi:hypothetical protein